MTQLSIRDSPPNPINDGIWSHLEKEPQGPHNSKPGIGTISPTSGDAWEDKDAQGRMPWHGVVGTTVLTHLTPLLKKSCHDSIYSYITPSYNIPCINNNFKTVIGGGNKLCSFLLLEWRAEMKFYSLRTSMKLSTCKYLSLHNNKKILLLFYWHQ